MNKKIIIGVIVVVIMLVFWVMLDKSNSKNIINIQKNDSLNVINPEIRNEDVNVKEFSMTSFVEMVDGEPKPQFSLKEITVNRGDKVRLKITVTSGMHDFKIDEFDVYADTQPNTESVVEFIADEAGEFTYYCTKPGHRQNGHWGTLKVL